jgi:hypothetical protein
MKEKLLYMIDKYGLFSVPKLLGVSIYKVISIKDGLTHKPKSTYTIGITELPDEIFDIFVNLYWEGS